MATNVERTYEGLFLVDPGFANKDPDAAVELCKGVLEKHGATIIRAELWAEQKLAYEVRKNKRGAYILAAFRSEEDIHATESIPDALEWAVGRAEATEGAGAGTGGGVFCHPPGGRTGVL